MEKHCIVCTLLILHGIALAFVQRTRKHFLLHIQSRSTIILNSLVFDLRFLGLERGESKENCIHDIVGLWENSWHVYYDIILIIICYPYSHLPDIPDIPSSSPQPL